MFFIKLFGLPEGTFGILPNSEQTLFCLSLLFKKSMVVAIQRNSFSQPGVLQNNPVAVVMSFSLDKDRRGTVR